MFNRNFYTKITNAEDYKAFLNILDENNIKINATQQKIYDKHLLYIRYNTKIIPIIKSQIARRPNNFSPENDEFIPIEQILSYVQEEDPIPKEQRYFIGAA